jgi:hypothetical protein
VTTPDLATATTVHCRATLVKDRRTGIVDCANCGLHGRIGDHLTYSQALVQGLSIADAYEHAQRSRRVVNRMLRAGTHTETVIAGPTKRQLTAAARAALLATQMEPLFAWPPPNPPEAAAPAATHIDANVTAEPDAKATPALLVVTEEQRLPHPNPHGCAHCTNRATLLLTLVTGDQVTTCRPHASRYPR